MPVLGQDVVVSVLISNPSFQHPLLDGPFVQDALVYLRANDCEDDDDDAEDLDIDRDVTAQASARTIAEVENSIAPSGCGTGECE